MAARQDVQGAGKAKLVPKEVPFSPSLPLLAAPALSLAGC